MDNETLMHAMILVCEATEPGSPEREAALDALASGEAIVEEEPPSEQSPAAP